VRIGHDKGTKSLGGIMILQAEKTIRESGAHAFEEISVLSIRRAAKEVDMTRSEHLLERARGNFLWWGLI